MCGSPSPRPRLRLVEFAPPLHRSRTSTWSDIVPGLAQAIARLSMKSSTSSKASSRMENASNRHRRYQQSAPIVIRSEYKMAPEEGLEPTTLRLTADQVRIRRHPPRAAICRPEYGVGCQPSALCQFVPTCAGDSVTPLCPRSANEALVGLEDGVSARLTTGAPWTPSVADVPLVVAY